MKRDPKTGEMKVVKKLSVLQTVRKMYKRDGLAAFFRGLGPALILTINPIIAYTSFEQIKNLIIARRGAQRLPTGTQGITSKPVVLPLTDLDNFLLGAFCKLLATGSLYPYLVVKVRMCPVVARPHISDDLAVSFASRRNCSSTLSQLVPRSCNHIPGRRYVTMSSTDR